MDRNSVKVRTSIPGTCAIGSNKWHKYPASRKPPLTAAQRLARDEILLLLTNRTSNVDAHASAKTGQISFAEKRELVAGFRELLNTLQPTHFLTFTSAMAIKPETFAKRIVKFCCRLDRKALGKKWTKCDHDRLRLLAFLEHPNSNAHYHALAVVPECAKEILESQGTAIWNRLGRGVQLDVKLIYGLEGVISYVTKDLHHFWAPENVLIYKPIPPK